eukprot:6460430-Amphidinium_carterae.1
MISSLSLVLICCSTCRGLSFPFPLGRSIALLMQLLLLVHTVSWAPHVMKCKPLGSTEAAVMACLIHFIPRLTSSSPFQWDHICLDEQHIEGALRNARVWSAWA